MQWTREEPLSTVAIAEFVELPERKPIQSSAAESENFINHVLGHISDAQAASCTCTTLFYVSRPSRSHSTRYQRAESTWRSRLVDLHQNWKPLLESITDACLQWKCGGYTDSSTDSTSVDAPDLSPPCP